MSYTKEEKKVYFDTLRKKRAEAKQASEKMDALQSEERDKIRQVIPNMSGAGYMFCKIGMKQAGLEGTPGIDMRTFKKWRDVGYKVKKGEKSKVSGLTWIKIDKEGEDGFMIPKAYALFHKSQVEALV